MNTDESFRDIGQRIDNLTHELASASSRVRTGMGQSTQSASAQVVNGTTALSWAVGLIGVFAVVVAVAAVFVVNAYREADARVAAERAAMQAQTNENLQDRVAVIERIIARMERDRTGSK